MSQKEVPVLMAVDDYNVLYSHTAYQASPFPFLLALPSLFSPAAFEPSRTLQPKGAVPVAAGMAAGPAHCCGASACLC